MMLVGLPITVLGAHWLTVLVDEPVTRLLDAHQAAILKQACKRHQDARCRHAAVLQGKTLPNHPPFRASACTICAIRTPPIRCLGWLVAETLSRP